MKATRYYVTQLQTYGHRVYKTRVPGQPLTYETAVKRAQSLRHAEVYALGTCVNPVYVTV